MRRDPALPLVTAMICALLLGAWPLAGAEERAGQALAGKVIYERHCQRCHGAAGRGDGPQAPYQLLPPTDFHAPRSRGKSDEQLLRAIEYGMVYSPMHAWRPTLTETEREAVLAYVRLLTKEAH